VLPGTLGTYIENSSDLLWVKAFRLWSQDGDSALDPLQLDPNGIDPMFPYDTARVAFDKGYEGMIRKLVPCDVPIPKFCETQHHYDITMGALQDAGYVYHNHADETRDQTLFAFGYDWRRSAQDNAIALRNKIKHVLALTGAKQVDILAHSQGGLVTNAYLHIWGSEGDVRRVVTLGTPYLGTPKFLGILQFKEPCEIAVGDNCILNRNEAAKLVHNFPGSIQLLPSERYWQVAASPLIERVQPLSGPSSRVVESYDGMVSRLEAGKQNRLLISAARTLHGYWDHWPATPGVDVLRIAGTKEATIGTIEEYVWNGCIITPEGYMYVWHCGWHTEIKNHYTSGDGTVVSASAQLRNCRTGVNLAPGELSLQRAHVSHEGLVHDTGTMNAAIAFLRHGTVSGPACPATVLRRRLASAEDDGLDATELRTTGPLVGSITDGTDVTGTIDPVQDVSVVNIPGSSFDPADGSASYVVTNDAQLQGTFTAAADGPVSLEVHRYADDNLVETAVLPRTDVKAGAVVSLAYARPQDLSLLQATIDDDGNGTVDRTVSFLPPVSGDAAEDDTPPTSTVTVTHFVGSDGTKLARVVVDAADEGGSGVGQIRYQTSRGASGIYTEPLVLPAQGDISVTAVDRAGNVQTEPSWGVLDDRPGAPFLVTEFLAPHVNATGFMDYQGDEDWWGVQADGGRIQLQLVGLTFDADLEVYDEDGTLLGSSTSGGKRSEKVDLTVPAGRYELRVYSRSGEFSPDHPYRVNVTALG
jgi:pimeloyl-ACP methyl ester carboxylesterase